MGFDGAADDGEAEAGAFDFLAMVFGDAVEAFEDEGEVGAGDADAVVGDADDGGCVFAGHGDGDFEIAWLIFLEGVFDEIEEDLVPVEAVAFDFVCAIWREVESEAGAFFFDERGETFDDVFGAFAAGERGGAEAGDAFFADGFEFGQGEHVLDDAGDAFAVFLHRDEGFPGHGGVVDVAFEEVFEVAVDDGERGPQFVGGIGDEVLADLFGFVAIGFVADDDAEVAAGGVAGELDWGGGDDEEAFIGEVAADDGAAEFFFCPFGSGGVEAADELEDAFVADEGGEGAAAEVAGDLEEVEGFVVGEGDVVLTVEKETGIAEAFEDAFEDAGAVGFAARGSWGGAAAALQEAANAEEEAEEEEEDFERSHAWRGVTPGWGRRRSGSRRRGRSGCTRRVCRVFRGGVSRECRACE